MNQNPEQLARDRIDQQLTAAGWVIQTKKTINLAAGTGVAIREYTTEVGPADYILFINRKPVGVIEAKREEEAVRLTTVEEQSAEYANARIKYFTTSIEEVSWQSYSYILTDKHVCINTHQWLYSIQKGEELDEGDEEYPALSRDRNQDHQERRQAIAGRIHQPQRKAIQCNQTYSRENQIILN